jgi:lysophospholipase L1-like esterase
MSARQLGRRLGVAIAIVGLVLVALAVTPPATSATGTTDAATAWCAALDYGDPVIDVIGDSIMNADAATQVSYRWWSMLGESLRNDGAPGTQIWTGGSINGSHAADYTASGPYAGHTEFTVHQPDLIVMDWSINDWWAGVTPAAFKASYQAVIDRIRVLSPGSTILLLHTPWVYNADLTSTRGDQAPYRDVIQQLAHDNGALYLGLEWMYAGDDRGGLATADRVHLNDVGQIVQYAAIRSYLLGVCA